MSARSVAFDVIHAVSVDDAYANLLLPARIRRDGLSTADAALATELTYGTLRRQGYYDAVIELAAGRSVDKIDLPILDVLRLGTHQLLSMRVADHAAVNESVEQARRVGSRSAVGFVNGVLRTISRNDDATWRLRVLGDADTADGRLAAEYSHPEWIIRAFRQALANDGVPKDQREASLVALLEADNTAPQISLAALPGLAADSDDGGVTPLPYSPVGRRWPGGDPLGWSAIREGRFRVQDEGSQLAALTLSRARPVVPGERWLDLCAGPGGKAALLAAEAIAGGATLVANEVVPARAELVRKALVPLADGTEVRVGDGRTLGDEQPEAYDRVIVDAPCSGLGALRRRPESRWRKRPADIADLRPLQRALLDSAIRATKPGGLIAYVTCSPHVAETRQIVAAAIKDWAGVVTPVAVGEILQGVSSSPLPGVSGDTVEVQLWPHVHGTDAMFIALLTKA